MFDKNLSIMIDHFNSPYFSFKNSFFIDWYGILSNVNYDYNSFFFKNLSIIIESMKEDGIFFYKKIENNKYFYKNSYFNLHSVFLYWNNYVYSLLSFTDKNNINNIVVYLVNNGIYINDNIMWFNMFINFDSKFKFIENNLDVDIYKYIYKNIFMYDILYSFLYGEYSFLNYFNERIFDYNRVFHWNEKGISKLNFYLHRYFVVFIDFFQNEILSVIYSISKKNNNYYFFSGLVNIYHGFINIVISWFGLLIIINILNISLVWYYMYNFLYKYDIWIHINKLFFPKDLDFFIRNTDIDRNRTNFFLKGLIYNHKNDYDSISSSQSRIDKLDALALRTEKYIKEYCLFNVKHKFNYFLSKLIDMTSFSSKDSKIYERFIEEEGLIFVEDDYSDSFVTRRKVREKENLERYGETRIEDVRKLSKRKLNGIFNILSKFQDYVDKKNWKYLNSLRYETRIILENDIFYSPWWTSEGKDPEKVYMNVNNDRNTYMVYVKRQIPFYDKSNIYMDIVNSYYQFSYFPYISTFFPYFPNYRIFSLFSFKLKFSSFFKKHFNRNFTYFFFRPRKTNIISFILDNNISSFFTFFYSYFIEFFEKYKHIYITIYFLNVYLMILLILYIYVADKSFFFFTIIVIIDILFILFTIFLVKMIKLFLRNNNIFSIIFIENKFFFNLLIFLLCRVFFFAKNNEYIYSDNYIKNKKDCIVNLNKLSLLYNGNKIPSAEIVSVKNNILIFSNLSFNSIISFKDVFITNVINNFFFSKYLEEITKIKFYFNKNNNNCIYTNDFSYFYLFKYYLSAYDIVYKTKLYYIDDNTNNNYVMSKNLFDKSNDIYSIKSVFSKNNSWWFCLYRYSSGKWITSFKLLNNKDFIFTKIVNSTTTIYNIKVENLFKYFNISINDKLFLKFFNNKDDILKNKINLIEIEYKNDK